MPDPAVCIPETGTAASPHPLVLTADDEPHITRLISLVLSDAGFRVVSANGGAEALRKAEDLRPDVVLLDLMMPGFDGFEVMRELQELRSVPVILLTGRCSVTDRAKGLELGADDYVSKPFNPEELVARVRAVLRRSHDAATATGVVAFDDVEIDLDRRLVRRAGAIVEMSGTEWTLLQYLAANPGKVLLYDEILTKTWGPAYVDDIQYLRVWISRIRRKLGATPGRPGPIRTFAGIGYLFAIEDVHPGRPSPGPRKPAEALATLA